MSQTPTEINNMINKVGLYLTPIFVVATFGINADWFKDHWGGDMKWGGMGLHPYLMSVSFIIINPLSIISFRVLRDMFGVPHRTVMAIHGFLQTSTLIMACVAVKTMWMHMDSWSEDHLGSVHALMGMFMLITWGVHVVISLFIFYLGPKWLKGAFRQIHTSLGFAYSIAMLLVILAGIVFEEEFMSALTGSGSIYIYQKTKAGAVCLLFLIFNMYLALYSKPTRRKQ